MDVDFEEIRKLDDDTKVEKLLGWGIQRQLRWAVSLITALVALLQLYFQIDDYYYFSILNIGSIKTELLGLLVILGVVTIGLWVCEGRTIEYYHYVATIEEIWAEKQETKLTRKATFTPQNDIDKFIMKCPSNAKLFFRLISLGLIFCLYILPLLL